MSEGTAYQWNFLWTNWHTDILAVVNDTTWTPPKFYQWWANFAASTA